jgi:hypothetical protein
MLQYHLSIATLFRTPRNANQIMAIVTMYCNRSTFGCDNSYLLQRSLYFLPRDNFGGNNLIYRNQKSKWLREHHLLQPNFAVAPKNGCIRVKS